MRRSRGYPSLGAALAVALVGAGLAAAATGPRLEGPGVPCPIRPAAMGARQHASRPAESTPPDTAGFVIFGWVSPPALVTTDARIAEMAAIGLNLTLPAWLDEGCVDDNLARLDWAAAHGMRCLIWDSRLIGALQWLPTFEDTLDTIASDYRDHPGFWGYYLGDEPKAPLWPLLGRIRESLRSRDPLHPGWNNLSGRAAYPDRAGFEADVRDFSAILFPAVLCADHYEFRYAGDLGQFTENLAALRAQSDRLGIPFWTILQLIPHAIFRPLHEGELRWQVAQALAFGARGIGYFTYWTPDPDPDWNWQPSIIDNDGRRTPWYDFLLGFNPGLKRAGETLARAAWQRTRYAGSVPAGGEAFAPDDVLRAVEGRAALGEFAGAAGEKLVLVANADSLAVRVVTLTTARAPGARLIAGGSSPVLAIEPLARGARLSLTLAAGDFALIALDPPVTAASFMAVPNPGSTHMRFDIRAPGGGKRLEIMDSGGRVVWVSSLPVATGAIEWDGRRGDGRRAAPGVYFARLSGGGAADVARRFVWLGAR